MSVHTSADPAAARHWTPDCIGDLAGRTALITGGNSGIGLESARVLARHGARVILSGRDQRKLDEAVAGLRAGQPDALLDTTVIDLGSLESIAAATSRLARSEAIDLLL